MARPKQTSPRDHQLNLSLTAAELNGLRIQAAAAGQRLVEYGRNVLLNGHRIRRTAPTQSRDYRLLHAELRRIGNNLNQIARRLNALDMPLPAGFDVLLRDIRTLLDRSAADDR